jgi:hypothetical protein
MSATGRAPVRHPDDFYETPDWCTRAILRVIWRPDATWFDPCAGRGAILEACARFSEARGESVRHRKFSCYGVELNPARADESRLRGFSVDQGDAMLSSWRRPELAKTSLTIVTNPPYRLALPFVVGALAEKPLCAAFLLRLNWLASQERQDFHRKYPADVYVLPRRPSFCVSLACVDERCSWRKVQPPHEPRPGWCPKCCAKIRTSSSDATEYAWFVWNRTQGGHWAILKLDEETEEKGVRDARAKASVAVPLRAPRMAT